MSDLTIEIEPAMYGRHAVTVSNGEPLHVDEFKVARAKDREVFIKSLVAKHPDLSDCADDIDRRIVEESARVKHGEVSPEAPPEERPTPDKLLAEMPGDIIEEANKLLDDPDILDRIVADACRLGVAGESGLVRASYLIGTSRLLDKPLAAIVQGASSSGKSFVMSKVADLIPPEGILRATALTPNALYHLPPGSLRHVFVLAGERSRRENDDIADATKSLREMISEGRLSKLMPGKPDGEIVTEIIEQDGPIAYAESTTRSSILDEDTNRCLILSPNETSQQTGTIIESIARKAQGGESNADRERVIEVHHAAQRMLTVECDGAAGVSIPFAGRLGDAFSRERVEARRGFPMLISAINAVALLHARQRERDGAGRIVAEPQDYEVAREVFGNAIGRSMGSDMGKPARRALKTASSKIIGTFTPGDVIALEDITVGDSAVYGYFNDWRKAGAVKIVSEGKGSASTVYEFTNSEAREFALPSVEAIAS